MSDRLRDAGLTVAEKVLRTHPRSLTEVMLLMRAYYRPDDESDFFRLAVYLSERDRPAFYAVARALGPLWLLEQSVAES